MAAIAWLASSAWLSWYLANFANYDAPYGSLGAAIGMMMWMWVSSIVILVGAELNSEIERTRGGCPEERSPGPAPAKPDAKSEGRSGQATPAL